MSKQKKIKKIPYQIVKVFKDMGGINGMCIECDSKVNPKERKQHKAYKLVTLPSNQVDFDEDMAIDDGVECIKDTMQSKGIPLSSNFHIPILKPEAKVTDIGGTELNMPFCCKDCGMTIYPDFIKTRRPITYVKLIGYKNSGKTCFCASVFNKHSSMMYPGTVEKIYFHDVGNLIKNGIAPEPTPDSMISSPILLVKFNGKYIGIKDVPGENIQLTAASIKKGDVVALVVNIQDETTITKIIDEVIPQINNEVSKIVICISQIDKLSECHIMENGRNITEIIKSIMNLILKGFGIDSVTNQFLKEFEDKFWFKELYKECLNVVGKQNKKKICIVGHAALGTEVDADGKFKDDYNPMYIDETLKTFIGD